MPKNIQYEKSSGNVFKDLELKNSKERLFKAKIAAAIHEIIKRKGLTQKAAADLLGIDQPKISALSNGRLSGFTIDRLFRFLCALHQDIEVRITETRLATLTTKRKTYSITLGNDQNEKRSATK